MLTKKPQESISRCSDDGVNVEPLVSAGVDWITLTCKPGDTQSEFEEMAHALMNVQAQFGNKVKPWSMSGFNGLSCGSVGFGAREDLSLLRLSADVASNDWRRGYRLATHCSRIDLQATFRISGDVMQRIRACHNEALEKVKDWTRPPEVLLRDSNTTGLTLYLNKRSSDRFGRVYDKGVESQRDYFQNCVRFECQYNGECGSAMARALVQRPVDKLEVLPYLSGYFSRRGVSLPLPNVACYPLIDSRRRTDAEAMLKWLHRQVRPAIGKLLAQGFYDDVIRALQLPNERPAVPAGPNGPTQDRRQPE